jgi:hypothetical protein
LARDDSRADVPRDSAAPISLSTVAHTASAAAAAAAAGDDADAIDVAGDGSGRRRRRVVAVGLPSTWENVLSIFGGEFDGGTSGGAIGRVIGPPGDDGAAATSSGEREDDAGAMDASWIGAAR